MPKYWLDHVHLVSPDPSKTAEFYEKTFGARRYDTQELPEGRVLISIDLNGMSFRFSNPRKQALAPTSLPGGCGLEHFGLGTDNLEAAVGDLKAQAIRFVQDITTLPSGVRISFFLSPEDVLVELLQR